MAFELFDTITLLDVIRVQDTFTPFWLNYFPKTITSDKEEIMFDLLPRDRRLAPFVAPNVQGRVQREKGFTTKTFKPAYIKPKHEVDPSRAIPRMAGEGITGTMTLEARYNAIIANNMQMEKDSIMRRWEWMAASAIINSSVLVASDDYPAVTVSFGRDASLSIVLAGTATWDSTATADPLADLEHARRQVQRASSTSITRLVFGLDAWAAFTENAAVQKLLNAFYRGSDTDYNTAVAEGVPFEFRGILSGSNGVGRLELYTYDDTYEDPTGQLVPYLDAGTVVGLGPGLQGFRMFGAIKDRRAGLAPLDMFPKMWDEEDPSVTFTMTQSAPLMVPAQPNASFTMKVCPSVQTYPSIYLGYPGNTATPGYVPAS